MTVQRAKSNAFMVAPEDQWYYNAQCLIGEIRTERKEYEGAAQAIEKALKLTDRHPVAYLRKAWLDFAQEQFDDAVAAVERAEE